MTDINTEVVAVEEAVIADLKTAEGKLQAQVDGLKPAEQEPKQEETPVQ